MSTRTAWLLASALAVLLPSWGCGQNVVGTPCSAAEPCPHNFDCTFDRDGDMVCAFTCDYPMDTICPDGSVCLPIGSMGDACYAGGTTSVGGTCMDDFDCVHGAICLHVLGSTTPSRCFRGCNYGEPNTCPGSSHCSPATSGGGYCP